MSIEDIDEIADAMVKVCVRDFGASPMDGNGDLLWLYLRDRLIESARDIKDDLRRAQTESLRVVDDLYSTRDISIEVEKRQLRRKIAEQLSTDKGESA